MKKLVLFTAFSVLLALSACSDAPSNRFQGYVEGEYVEVASPIGGTLTGLEVSRGQQVAADAPLFVLDDTFERAAAHEAAHGLQRAKDNLANLEKGRRPSEIATIEARLKQATTLAGLAKIEYERRQKLIAEQTISQEELDRARSDYNQKYHAVREIESELTTARLGGRSDEVRAAQAEVQQARAKLDQAQWNLDQKSKAAPAAGLVFDTLYRVGEWVAAGRPVVSLLPPANVEVRFFVPETVVGRLAKGWRVLIAVDGETTPVPAEITYISPSAEYTPPVIYSTESRAKLVFMVRAKPTAADAPRLHPGQPVDVTVPELAAAGQAAP
ncbi:HlyD family efflux transporter periplasmic adaptor subunit [Pseudodesulfovibrio sp.]|uniref:HlyD family secretion protein n=1 Tax=Pseudodesulfovibrio sp. TaxID=2035812 RepID=UPI0026046F20|nr:HlyD family efflux transporter periplasmic adaptor subunit [Pseudodesulfovibrio sp.]MDD3310695.1 HlyD family efflux transporter periplasmic adaptor subunit [Pseudodesulfovibrio sp.]